ncbi:uncharacterized protein LOC114521651 [Dendronephthya gigantea]|uniref:uncharacterized protein LOC114521651 n=1 Tax=Dendronephthya gigantea TaxID=151771 RepID=UPI00106C4EF1|nr:uncharacterized protein LOC114521651 [Dendronephthya gigantea]
MLCVNRANDKDRVSDCLLHDINCEKECCENIPRIDRCVALLDKCEELTSAKQMAEKDEPLYEAFKLTNDIRKLRNKNKEINAELKEYSKKAKTFTVDLLDICKSDDEVGALFGYDRVNTTHAHREKVKVLRKAIEAGHKGFVAHRHTQQLLCKIVYADFPAKSFLFGLPGYFLYSLTFPLFAFAFLFFPKCRISHYMKSPFGYFLSHVSQFCVFVALLVHSSLRDSHEPSETEILIYAFVLTMCLQEGLKMLQSKEDCRSYFKKWWNWVLIVMLCGFLISGLFWLIGSSAIGGWAARNLKSSMNIAGHNILLTANGIFSISAVISIVYLGSLAQVNAVFGPLQLSTLRMAKDILKFLTIFLGIFFAFTLGVRNLYSYNHSLEDAYLDNNSTAYREEAVLGRFGNAWRVMFWALFDQTNIEKFDSTHPKFEITSKVGKVLFAIYLIIAVLVGINMLIAMMNNSFEYVANDKDDMKWKMSRAAMWKNVKTTYQTYYVTEHTTTKRLSYTRTCTETCSTHIGWCWSYTTVCRNVPKYRWVTVSKRVARTRPVYSCYSGWSPNYRGTECTIPICSGGCKNGGTCISPSNCRCTSGWTGSRCRTDINECQTNKHGCGYKPGCVNTKGSYRCTCRAGYYLMSDNRNCKDINECISNPNSCGANTRCVNNPGSYTCPCLSGFIYNTGSRRSCKDINECDPASGVVHGCQGTCINMIGTYRCDCSSGHFLASDGRSCTDHDECATDIHGCQQLCVNFPGGYNCSCSAGYRLDRIDQKSCNDVDECSENTAGCAHNCTNEVGSFKCSCELGYHLGTDAKSCNDVNECSSGLHHCQHNCINTPGSYKCSCRSGFDLLQNGGDCAGRPCIPIFNPLNGVKNCSGYTTEKVCHFECSPGYDLVGSSNRTCTDLKSWTGEDTKCEIIHCPTPAKPSNGFIYSPCNTYFASQCTVGCSSGYYIDRTVKIACDAHRVWQPGNITCSEIEICRPNPCLHGGTCSAINSKYYSCNCTQTGYIGTKCDIGYITIPDYPTLTPGVPSQHLTYKVSPPSENVVLTPKSRDIEFEPPNLLFKHGTPSTRSLRMTARKPGVHFIRYSLSGPSAGYFKSPDESVVLVKSSEQLTFDKETVPNAIPSGCYKQQVDKCPRSNDAIYASSTSPWVTFGPMAMTSGVVNLMVGATTIPLSLLGTNLIKSSHISSQKDCDKDNQVSYSTEQLITERLLEKTFLNKVSNSLPKWLQITLPNNSVSTAWSPSELQTYYVSGKNLRTAYIGEGQPIDDGTYYSLLNSQNLNLSVDNDVDLLLSGDNKAPLSIAMELCGPLPRNVILRPSLRDGNLISDVSLTRKLEENGWDIKFYSLQISKSKTIDMLRKRTLWNSKRFFNIESSQRGNLAIVLSLKKELRSVGFVNSSLEFEGTAVADLDDIDNISDSPFGKEWKLDLYGKITVGSKFRVKGKVTNMILEASESISYARFGGKKQIFQSQKADDDLQGLFFTNEIKQNPFIGTELSPFVEIGTNKTFSYFLDAMIYENKSSYEEISNGISMSFNGNLKYGPIRFENLHIELSIGDLSCSNSMKSCSNSTKTVGAVFTGDNYGKKGKTKFGIFRVSGNKPLNLLIAIARNKNSSSLGSFQAVTKILGFEKWVNVSFFEKGLAFRVDGKIHGLFDANMSCESRLATWENQIFIVDGVFEDRLTQTGLKHSLSLEMDRYAVRVFRKAMKRVRSINETEQRAKRRLEKVMTFEKLASETTQRAREEYQVASRGLKMAKQELAYLERAANNNSEELQELKSALDRLCPVKHCPDICQEGVSCTKCYQDIIGKAMGVCPATCFNTVQRRLPPLTEIVLCESQKCTRIHSTNGLFKRLLGETFGGILKSVVSFGISAFATFLGAPPPLSSALGSGIVQLLDTGRIDETLCSVAKGAITSFIGGPGVKKVFQQYSKTSLREGVKHGAIALGRTGVSKVVSKAISCQREQRDGHWKCHVVAVQCNKDRFQYEYEHTPYICKQSCEKDTVTKTIEKSCCSTVPCASLIVNLTCVAENVLCKKVREAAMEQFSKTKTKTVQILKSLENARQNVSYWTMKKRKDYIKFIAAGRSLNTSRNAVYSLRKAYNVSVETREKKLKLLARPLQIRSILDEHLTHVAKVKLETIRFKVKVSASYQSNLLPIFITFKINETDKEMFTVLDFSNLNASMRSVAKEILSHFVGDLSSVSRRKRSVEDTGNSELENKLSTLKDYHKLCAEFQNHQLPLEAVVRSLYDLSSEMRSLLEKSKRVITANVNVTDVLTNLNINLTLATEMGLATDNGSYVNDLNADPEMTEAEELHQEAARDGYEPLQVATKLLIHNWFVTMEDLFNDSRIAKECSGFDDCLLYILNSLSDIYSALELPGAQNVRDQIKDIETKITSLTQNLDLSVNSAVELSSEILEILENLTSGNSICGLAPNITKHPEAFVELGEGETLQLTCNATGSSLTYRWRYNTEILQDKSSGILSIENITASHSGNYTCEVSNHIAKETSIPARIVVISPPVIAVQPAEYLGVVLFSDDSLECQAQNNNRNISYQWCTSCVANGVYRTEFPS